MNKIEINIATCEQSSEDDFILNTDEMVEYVSRLDDLFTMTYVDVTMIHYSRRSKSVTICFDHDFNEKHGFDSMCFMANDIHTAPVMFSFVVNKIHECMRRYYK